MVNSDQNSGRICQEHFGISNGGRKEELILGLTRAAVVRQVVAMGVQRFQIGLREQRNNAFEQRCWGQQQLLSSLAWLRYRNAHGAHLYIRPALFENLILLDDINQRAIRNLTVDGLRPAVVLETSPNNFQVWLRLSGSPIQMPMEVVTHLITKLVSRYDADSSSADWHHYGRLVGFTNRKPEYRDHRGRYPFVILRQWSGCVARAGISVLKEAQYTYERQHQQRSLSNDLVTTAMHTTGHPGTIYEACMRRILARCHGQAWRGDIDWSRMDYMIAREMVREGHPRAMIEKEISTGSPNISLRKGVNLDNYIRRTVDKAIKSLTT